MVNIPKVNVNVDVDGNKIYNKALDPIVSPTAKTLGLLPRAIHAAFVPLEKWILNKEYNLVETQALLEQKLHNVPPEKIVPPEPYVAVPAMQALSYSISNADLCNMYASLLAKSMHISAKDYVHPSFVEAIKQMSPVDATIFKHIAENNPLPMINLVYEIDDGYKLLETNITGFDFAEHEIMSASIDNLTRLKLIEIPWDETFVNSHKYQPVLASAEYNELHSKHNSTEGESISYEEKLIRITSLGTLFYKICVAQSFCIS